MADVTRPWIDGEQIPDDRLQQIFKTPPGVPPAFYRSSLVIGSRGVGKTTLFRYHKETHEGVAVHISLVTTFGSLTKQTGLGPLSFDVPEVLEDLLVKKATSLLALGIAERLARKGLPIPHDLLHPCLPYDFRKTVTSTDHKSLLALREAIAKAALEKFGDVSSTRPLPSLVSGLGEVSYEKCGPLLLLLDRADMVPGPSLLPVVELLDQSSQYVVLVATRPGRISSNIAKIADSIIAGDNYTTVHLGTQPYEDNWCEFVEAAGGAEPAGTVAGGMAVGGTGPPTFSGPRETVDTPTMDPD